MGGPTDPISDGELSLIPDWHELPVLQCFIMVCKLHVFCFRRRSFSRGPRVEISAGTLPQWMLLHMGSFDEELHAWPFEAQLP